MRLSINPILLFHFFLLTFLTLFFSPNARAQYVSPTNEITCNSKVYTGYRCPFKLRFIIRSGGGRLRLVLKPVFQKYREVLVAFSNDKAHVNPLKFKVQSLILIRYDNSAAINYKSSGLSDPAMLPVAEAQRPNIQFAYNPISSVPEF
jgi:hypothetical protein